MSVWNKNTLFMSSKSLTEKGIKEYVKNLISQIALKTNFGSDYFEVSMVRKTDVISTACFVWFTSPKLVNIILGEDEDIVHEIPPYENEKHQFFEKILIQRSRCKIEKNLMTDTIFCSYIDQNVTKQDIWNEFRRYNVSGGPDGIHIMFYEKENKRQCIIEYEKGSMDGLFAQQMKMFCNIREKEYIFTMKYLW